MTGELPGGPPPEPRAAPPDGGDAGLRARVRAAVARLRGGALSPARAASSVALGLFVGMLPLWGLQLPLILAAALPLGLDAALAYVAAMASNPLTLPLQLAAALELGARILGRPAPGLDLASLEERGLAALSGELAVGSVALGALLAGLGFAATFPLVGRLTSARPRGGLRRTLRRYAHAPRAARGYVAGKLLFDPALRRVAALPGPLGRLVDIGCGHGQLSLALLDAGRATTALGSDPDATRVRIARDAAAGDAEFLVGAGADHPLPDADTILLIDVLHYLPPADQDALLRAAARALAPGGRLVVRDLDQGHGPRSRLTAWLERRAVRRRGEAGDLHFRPRADTERAVAAAGLLVSRPARSALRLLDDAFTVGTRPPPEA